MPKEPKQMQKPLLLKGRARSSSEKSRCEKIASTAKRDFTNKVSLEKKTFSGRGKTVGV
jgi:hypothetical protein